MASSRLPTLLVLAALPLLHLAPFEANAFRIIASSSGAAGIAQAPCCDTGFDEGSDSSTSSILPGPPPTVNVVMTDGSKGFLVPSTVTVGEFAGVSLSGQARASMFDIGARATVALTDWDSNFTGGSIEAFASARLEQIFTPASSAELYVRPVFQIDGSISHAAGFSSSITFNMRATLPGDTSPSDNILLHIDTGTPGTTVPLDAMLVGPDLVVAAGSSLFLSLQLSTQVSGTVNDIPGGDHFGEVDAFNTLSLLGFETYSDPGYSMPVSVDFLSDSGLTVGTVPEPGMTLLFALGLAALGYPVRRR